MMENLIKCPKCNGGEDGCSYCSHIGYVISEGGSYYTVTIDSKDNPIKGMLISSPSSYTNDVSSNKLFTSLFPEQEPHDMEWFFKKK